jgi:hypothetical protein
MIWVVVCEVVVGIALVAISAGVMIMLVAGMEATSSQVEQKAVALLKPWLSPEQAEQYRSYRYFEVIGSDTGKRYKMQGVPTHFIAESHCAVRSWKNFSLKQEQGEAKRDCREEQGLQRAGSGITELGPIIICSHGPGTVWQARLEGVFEAADLLLIRLPLAR